MEEQKVFISHSVKDTDWARSLAHALKKLGVSVWFGEFGPKSGEMLHRQRAAKGR
jgi:hypothetical protein